MKQPARAININACAQKLEIDNRISLRYYYRIADNLLKQAAIYREEKNIIDLYVILLRFSSLITETIPCHKDFQVLLSGEKNYFKKKLFDALSELESLKPDVQFQVDEHNARHAQLDGWGRIPSDPLSSSIEWPSVKKHASSNHYISQANRRSECQVLQKHGNDSSQVVSPYTMQIDRKFYNLSLNLPRPKEETMSKHSILGPNGLRGQWTGPITSIKVQYPSNIDSASIENPGLNQAGEYGLLTVKDDSEVDKSTMESVLSLDDGRWSVPADGASSLSIDDIHEDSNQLIRQPSPPPVLAQMEDLLPISPSKVADPRPGPAKPIQDGLGHSKTYLQLHIPVKMMDEFLKVAQKNTQRNLETCGVLAGSLKNRMFYITALIIPKQESTSNSCQATNEEEIFDVQDKQSLFPLGWIHTHPSQTCFMSSVDLHTHYSYQIMLPEAVAIVMAPTDTSRTHGIFHLSDPGGVSVIRGCQQRGFHPHEEPPEGGPIYEHCSHVFMNPNLKFDVIDLR